MGLRITKLSSKPIIVEAGEMDIGQVGIDGEGNYLLRAYGCVVSMTDPEATWDITCSVPVTLLQGERLLLEIDGYGIETEDEDSLELQEIEG